jgi:hypothetical protein
MKYNFNEELKKDEKNMGGSKSSLYYKVEEGNNNVLRILSPSKSYTMYFLGKGMRPAIAYGYDKGDPRKVGDEEGEFKPSVRYACYVLDKTDNEIKMAEFPYSVQKGIAALQENPDFAFEELPMPYDIRITYNKEESPANMYTVTATPKNDPLTEEELATLKDKMEDFSPEDYVEKKKEKQMESDQEAGVWISEEKRKQNEKDWLDRVNSKNEGGNEKAEEETPTIDYPEDDIKPEDIPF